MSEERKTAVRAMVLPILKPLDGDWPSLRQNLDTMFDACRKAANLITSAIYTRDMEALAQCAPGDIPKAHWSGVDKIAKSACPELPRQILSGIDHFVKLRYRGKNSEGQRVRLACMFGWQSLPSHVNVPIPCSPADGDGGYKLWMDGADLLLDVPLMRRPNPNRKGKVRDRGVVTRRTVLLKTLDKSGRPRMHAQTIRRALENKWKLGTLRIFKRGKHVMVAIPVHIPVHDNPDADGTMSVRFEAESLLVANVPGSDVLWTLHADQLRQTIAMERRAQQRLRDDYKFEPRREKRGARQVMRRRSQKAKRRIDAMLHDLARQVVGRAERARVRRIEIDDSCREYLPNGGPYAELITKIEQKAEQCGIIVDRTVKPAKS